MSVDTPARRAYRFGNTRSTGLVGRRDLGEQLVLVAGGAVGLLAAAVIGPVLFRVAALLVAVGTAVAVVFVPYRPRGAARRRTVYRWWEIRRSYRATLRANRASWRSEAREAGIGLDGTDPTIGMPPGISRHLWLTAPTRCGQEVAVLLHLDRRAVTAAVEVDGPGMAQRDEADQVVLLDRWADLLNHLGNGTGFAKRIQIVARSLQSDPQAHTRDVADRGDPHAPAWLARSYDELREDLSTSAQQHRFYLVLHMDYTPELAGEAQACGGGDRGLGVVMARELDELSTRLADAELTVVGPLGVAALASLIRNSYDPDHPVDTVAGMRRNRAWPHELDVRDPQHLAARNPATAGWWYHATAAVASWPRQDVGVNFLAPLLVHTPDVVKTVSVVIDLEPNDRAVDRMLADATNDHAEAVRAAKLGKIDDPRDARAADSTSSRGADLARGAAGAAVAGYLTVSARSGEDLRRVKRDIESKAGSAFLTLDWCDLEHHRAFATTLPFAGGIR